MGKLFWMVAILECENILGLILNNFSFGIVAFAVYLFIFYLIVFGEHKDYMIGYFL